MPEDLLKTLMGFWDVLAEMAPYLLFGFSVAGVLSVIVSPQLVERHLGGRGLGSIFKAAAFGVPLPLCSCGVIPVSASLRRHGAGRGATTAFLISTPQDGVDSILVTYSLMGPIFMVFRVVTALVSGIIGGIFVSLFDSNGGRADPLPSCEDECCKNPSGNKLLRAVRYGFVTLPADLARALLVGLVVAALISTFVPDDYFAEKLPYGVAQILLMMAIGIPIYVCATASVPIAAALVIKGGVSPGAAFAFLITGPATNAATIATVWKVMGKRTTAIYLLTMAATAFTGGLILDGLVAPKDIRIASGHGFMLPDYVKWACAAVLLAILTYGALRRKTHTHDHAHEHGETLELIISGMHCSHCAETVHRALLETPGVTSVEVDARSGKAAVTGSELDIVAIGKAVESVGYSLTKTGR